MHTLKHRTLALIMSLIMILSCFAGMTFSASAGTSIDGFEYYMVDNYSNQIKVSKYTGTDSEVVIPSQINLPTLNITYPVVAIDRNAFEGNNIITSVTIPDSVKVIGASAFTDCKNLKTVKIPNSVYGIGDDAFSGCSNLESIEIPDSVTQMGERVFVNCKNLRNVKLSKSLTLIPYGMFNNCQNLTNVEIPNGITVIDEYSFFNCNLKNVVIPNTVTIIDANAFAGCINLESITIPESVTAIDFYAFGNNTDFGFIIRGAKGSTAEEYANERNIKFYNMYCEHENAEIRGGKDPTCIEPGQTGTKYCPTCKTTLSESEEIPALGHTEEKIPAKPATCTEKGLTDGAKCSVCGEILTAQTEIPALGHSYKDGVCTVCGAIDPDYKLMLNSDSKLILSVDNAMVFVIPESTGGMTAGDFKSQFTNKNNISIDDSAIITNGLKFNFGDTEYSIIVKGDANADGKISAADARAILRIAAKLESPDDITKEAADIDSDTKVTSSEARSVLRFAAKLQSNING